MKRSSIILALLAAALIVSMCACSQPQQNPSAPVGITPTDVTPTDVSGSEPFGVPNAGGWEKSINNQVGGAYSLLVRGSDYQLTYDPASADGVFTSPLADAHEWSLAYYPCLGSSQADHSDCWYDVHSVERVIFVDEKDGLLIERYGAEMSKAYYNFFRTTDGGATWASAGQYTLPGTTIGFARTDADTLLVFCRAGAYNAHMRVISLSAGTDRMIEWPQDMLPADDGWTTMDFYGYMTGFEDENTYSFSFRQMCTDGQQTHYYQYVCLMDSQFNVNGVDTASVQPITEEIYQGNLN